MYIRLVRRFFNRKPCDPAVKELLGMVTDGAAVVRGRGIDSIDVLGD